MFSALVQLNSGTINKHSALLFKEEYFKPYSTGVSEVQKGKKSIRTVIALKFLERFAELNAMSCPTGRGSSEDSPMCWLPSDTTKSQVHKSYIEAWFTIIDTVVAQRGPGSQPPKSPLGKDSFCKVWSGYFQHLRIFKKGSDFCHTCTQLKNSATTVLDPFAKVAILQSRDRHRSETMEEFTTYRDKQHKTFENPAGGEIHLVFDFAEKILLPSLLRQPGQLHFVTGLKFDVFGVSSSNLNRTFVFGLPEGKWPGGKTCNEVASMLHHCIKIHHDITPVCADARSLTLHADNCAGQKKNQFMLFYLAWRVLMGYEDIISLCFLVAGHTKNRCDSSFGHVKRCLKRNDVLCPADMFRVIHDSSKTNEVVRSTDVRWMNWKQLLCPFFAIPRSFRITNYHIFKFESSCPGVLKAKALSTTEEWKEVRLLRKSMLASTVRVDTFQSYNQGAHVMEARPLDCVPSQQEGTWMAYLVKNVFERYYAGNDGFKEWYFGSGADWGSDNA